VNYFLPLIFCAIIYNLKVFHNLAYAPLSNTHNLSHSFILQSTLSNQISTIRAKCVYMEMRWDKFSKRYVTRYVTQSSKNYSTSPIRPGVLRWGSKKWTLRGTRNLRKKVTLNGTEIPKLSQIFYFFPKFSKNRHPTRDWFFYFGVFATLPGTRGG